MSINEAVLYNYSAFCKYYFKDVQKKYHVQWTKQSLGFAGLSEVWSLAIMGNDYM